MSSEYIPQPEDAPEEGFVTGENHQEVALSSVEQAFLQAPPVEAPTELPERETEQAFIHDERISLVSFKEKLGTASTWARSAVTALLLGTASLGHAGEESKIDEGAYTVTPITQEVKGIKGLRSKTPTGTQEYEVTDPSGKKMRVEAGSPERAEDLVKELNNEDWRETFNNFKKEQKQLDEEGYLERSDGKDGEYVPESEETVLMNGKTYQTHEEVRVIMKDGKRMMRVFLISDKGEQLDHDDIGENEARYKKYQSIIDSLQK